MFNISLDKNVDAALLLLSKFSRPDNIEHYANDLNWHAVLGENPKEVINGFYKEGLIYEGNIKEKLDCFLTIEDLKDKLGKEDLKLSGNKNELLDRLIEEKKDTLEKEFADKRVFKCTDRGLQRSNEYLINKNEELKILEKNIFNFLKLKEFNKVFLTLDHFNRKQVFPRSLNKDYWNSFTIKHFSDVLKVIFNRIPKILEDENSSNIEILRLSSGMMALFGNNRICEIINIKYPNIKTKRKFDVSSRMMIFFAQNLLNLQKLKELHHNKIRILTASDSCIKCKEIAQGLINIESVIELPYSECTHKYGCRCSYIQPIFIDQH